MKWLIVIVIALMAITVLLLSTIGLLKWKAMRSKKPPTPIPSKTPTPPTPAKDSWRKKFSDWCRDKSPNLPTMVGGLAVWILILITFHSFGIKWTEEYWKETGFKWDAWYKAHFWFILAIEVIPIILIIVSSLWSKPATPPSSSPAKTGKGFGLGTLVTGGVILGVAYLFFSCSAKVSNDWVEAKKIEAVARATPKNMRQWTVIAPTNGWSEIVHTPTWYHTDCITSAKTIMVNVIKDNQITETLVLSGLNNPDTLGQGLQFKSLSQTQEIISVKQWDNR
jgi:hypothetical protein